LVNPESPRKGSSFFRKARPWFNLATAIILCALLYTKLKDDPNLFRFHLDKPVYLVPAVACVCLGFIFSALMWQILIPLPGRLPFFQLLGIFVKSMFLNFIFPTGVTGDVVRTLALSVETKRADTAVSSALMTRLTSLWVVVVLTLISISVYFRDNSSQYQFIVWLAIGALLITLVGTLILLFAQLPAFLLPRAGHWVERLADLRGYYRQPVILIQAGLCALAIQILSIAINFFVSQALLIQVDLGQLILAMPLINLITILPVSFGGFGVREGLYYLLLGGAGVAASQAVQLSLSVYFLILITTAIAAGIATLPNLRVWKKAQHAPAKKTREGDDENSHIQLA
jgi:glycosyltransferase 2 family protein